MGNDNHSDRAWSRKVHGRPAVDPSRVVPGAHLVAGSGTVRAVVVVVDVTDDGIVHVCDVPGSVEDNAHLLGDRSVFVPASRRLPDLLPDPVEVGGTARYDAGQRIAQIPCGTRGNGTQQDRPERTWNDRRSRPPNGVSMVGAWT